MPVVIDSSREPGAPRSRRSFLIVLAILAALFIAAGYALSYWVDLLWYRSLGYSAVFWTTLRLEIGSAALFAAATFVILYGAFTALRRAYQEYFPDSHNIFVNGQPVSVPVGPAVRIISLLVSAIVALVTGATMASDWPTLALFLYAPHDAGAFLDPIFGKPLHFFLFTLPALQLVAEWLLTLAFITCAAAVLVAVISGGARAFQKQRSYLEASPWRGLSITGAFLLLVMALNVYLSRFQSILEHHTIFDGVTYTDAHIMLGGLALVSVLLLIGAALAAYNAVRRPRLQMLFAAALPAAACYILLSIVGWYVGNFVVKPNELDRETPYIANNIAATRQAFRLDAFDQHEFPADTTLESADAANNQATLQNIRLWDWRALQDTLRQVQEIRTYYDFPDIDIDRYNINGSLSEVMLATRELNVDKLPESSRNWINEKLIYTHGYGITMNPVNGFTPEGLPVLYLSNMPVQSTIPSIKVTRPEIYFGELTDTDVYVKTGQKEFDYPQGQTNSLTSYEGTGGIPIGSFLNRLILAYDRGDIGKLPFSDDVTTKSRLLMHRDIRDRVATLAPFLTFDSDPYIVVSNDGHLYWMLDAYTTSDSYPYATHYDLDGNSVNYIRNSVKVVIDAYNGTTSFYVFDKNDPIIAAYRHIFPSLFKDASEMPPDLHQHIRYPEKLFQLQADVYGLYHMTNPEVFFNREDLWTVATETGTGPDGNQGTLPVPPNYVLMKLPGEANPEFVEILPFTPANRNNLIGWIAGRCDGANYGKAVVYDFPKTRLVDGPQQIESRIDQNADLSGQLTLWNQQGSHALRGNLLVIPMGRALLYAEPIYLQAQQSPMPELRLVVLALQDKLAYGPTFEAALTSLFGGEASALRSTANAASTPNAPPSVQNATPASPQIGSLIAEASKDFDEYQRLTSQGKLGEAGQKLEALKQVLNQLSAQRK